MKQELYSNEHNTSLSYHIETNSSKDKTFKLKEFTTGDLMSLVALLMCINIGFKLLEMTIDAIKDHFSKKEPLDEEDTQPKEPKSDA